MKIAISAEGPDPEATVSHRLGTSPYLIIVDSETMSFEAIPSEAGASGQHAGMHLVSLAIAKEVDAVLTGYCSPIAENYLSAKGIRVVTDVTGTVSDAVERYIHSESQSLKMTASSPPTSKALLRKDTLSGSLKKSGSQFKGFLPILIGVVLLIGLLSTFVSKDVLSFIFTGDAPLDTLLGACFGSIFTGNPINSYVIGGEMLGYGISLFAVTALMISWVTVGIAQLPAEIMAFGSRFALIRNITSFVLSIIIAFITVIILNLLGVRL